MPMLRTFKCDLCDKTETEAEYGEGVNNWGQFNGIILDGVSNPMMCPSHVKQVADVIDKIKRRSIE